MTQSLTERLQERLESQTAEIAALTESELRKLSQRVSMSVISELKEIEIAIARSTYRITNELPSLYWIVGLTWAALIVSLGLTGFLLRRSSQASSITDMPLEIFQSEGQTLMIIPDDANPVSCKDTNGVDRICLRLPEGI